ncbi:hypothetical protein SeMB42_g01552 [Synchytrium endobioticum]|uniref:Uncharacterized protein n=1 Tax=Synchytrium endobioticum TaxID=286115 RepID=A0A507DM21_9FUNG|nr:hypothetical protein SeMB42_g01552 [Synchytrium endobioticum]
MATESVDDFRGNASHTGDILEGVVKSGSTFGQGERASPQAAGSAVDRCSHCARRGVQEAVAEDPRLSGYARAQGKRGHVLMAKRTCANRLASVLEDAGLQSLLTVKYCETCSSCMG